MCKEKILKFFLLFKKKVRDAGKLKTRNTGLRKDVKDDRDYKLQYGEQVIFPVTWQIPINPYKYVKNQGSWNSCASHAMATGLEISFDLSNSNKNGVELSERFHYYMTRKRTGKLPKNVGMTMRDMLKTAQQNGICPEKLCPYISSKMNEMPQIFTLSFAEWFRIHYYMRVNGLDDMKKTLARNQPVLIGVQVNNSFRRLTGNIYVEENESLYGGHAITVIGYDDTEKTFTCINSWGTNYKDKGIMKVPYDYVEKYCFDKWTFTLTEVG